MSPAVDSCIDHSSEVDHDTDHINSEWKCHYVYDAGLWKCYGEHTEEEFQLEVRYANWDSHSTL